MTEPGKNAVVIVAAGRGERAGMDQGPKQYRRIGHSTVLDLCVTGFVDHARIDFVVVVIHEDDRALYAGAGLAHAKLLSPVIGGATRQQSVLAGLEALCEHDIVKVLIHDAARPFAASCLTNRVLSCLEKSPAALPAMPIADTLKRGDGGIVSETVSRNGLFAAQTPQGFVFDRILAAHRAARDKDLTHFTDDSALAEWSGMSVAIVQGQADNGKITTQADIEQAQIKMMNRLPDVRTGHGYDTHQLVPGNSIWLCGVEIAHNRKLKGHSDADVGLHALTDALLGAVADGDIGQHFPPSDERWRDARSDQFLRHAVGLVRDQGGTITHMDVTLICESPKIGPHREDMRKKMAAITGIDVHRVSVKATTNERIGFIGREEGLAALATATVVMNT